MSLFFKAQRNILAGQIYKGYYNAIYIKKQIEIKEKELKNLKELLLFIKKSYQLGETIPLDLLRVEKDLQIVKIQIENLKAQYKTALNNLSSIVGKQIKNVEGNIYELDKTKPIKIEDLPLIKYYSLLAESYNKLILRQKSLAKPQISVGFIAQEDAVDLGKYEFGISISSTIPVFYKNEGEIISITNQKKSILEKQRQTKLNYKAQIESIFHQYNLIKQQLFILEQNTITKIKEALELAEKGFKLRTISFFEYSNIRKQYFETLLYKASLANQAHQLYGEYIKIGGTK